MLNFLLLSHHGDAIVNFTAPTFRNKVINRGSTDLWFIAYVGNMHEDAEKHSQTAIAEMKKAAEETRKFCNFGIVNVTEEPFLAARIKIQYIPYICIYHSSGIDEYHGKLESSSFVEAITNRMPTFVRVFEKRWAEDGVVSAVLFTDQIKSPTLWSSLSLDLTSVRFGLCSDFYQHKQFNIARLPTVLLFNSTSQIRYKGELNEKSLNDAISAFANGTLVDSDNDDEGFYRLSEFRDQCFGRDYCVISISDEISDEIRSVKAKTKRQPVKFFYGTEPLPFPSAKKGSVYIWRPRRNGVIEVGESDSLSSVLDRVLDGGARFTSVEL